MTQSHAYLITGQTSFVNTCINGRDVQRKNDVNNVVMKEDLIQQPFSNIRTMP